MSASVFLFFQHESRTRPYEILSLLLALLAQRIAVYAKRVLAQERTFFAYELHVRRKAELALGWKLSAPRIKDLVHFRYLRSRVIVESDLSYGNPIDIEATMRFDSADIADISEAALQKRGAYGIFVRLFSFAWFIALIAIVVYADGINARYDIINYRQSIEYYAPALRAATPTATPSATTASSPTPRATFTAVPPVLLPAAPLPPDLLATPTASDEPPG